MSFNKLLYVSLVIIFISSMYLAYSNLKAHDHDLIINITNSLDGYIYRKVKTKNLNTEDFQFGTLVEVCFKENSKALKIDKILHKNKTGSCPTGRMPFLKMIGAKAGDFVKIDGIHNIQVNENQLLGTRAKDQRLPVFVFTGIVPKGKLLVFTNNINSLDSRYFGFIDENEVQAIIEQVL